MSYIYLYTPRAATYSATTKTAQNPILSGLSLCMCYKSDTVWNAEKIRGSEKLNRETACARSALEQITGVEPASSVWETEVMTAILYLQTDYINYIIGEMICQA